MINCDLCVLCGVSDLYYFLLAPTLCYQRDFPHTPKVRINKLLHRLLEMVSDTAVTDALMQVSAAASISSFSSCCSCFLKQLSISGV